LTLASVAVEPIRNDTVRITVAGEIDLSNAPTVERHILDAIPNRVDEVVLDLSALEYIDSAGLRLLFTLGMRLTTLQIGMVLVVPADSPVRRMIDISGVAAAMALRSTSP
jgi:anti-anti-sigma factor